MLRARTLAALALLLLFTLVFIGLHRAPHPRYVNDAVAPKATGCLTKDWSAQVRDVAAHKAGTRVLVTGAAGFIGSHVAEFCARDLKFSVIAVDDLSSGFLQNLPEGVHFVQGDLTDEEFVKFLFETHGPFEYVYHLAASAVGSLSHFLRRANYRHNLAAPVAVLNEAIMHSTKVMVFASSIAAYGAADLLPISESTPQHPQAPDGVAKHAFELDLRTAHDMFGIDFIIFRPHDVYGPRQSIADIFENTVAMFMNQALNKKPMTIFGEGEERRGFTYIDDVAPVIALAPAIPSARNEGFFLGTDTRYSVKELAEHVSHVMGTSNDIKHLDVRHEVPRPYAIHNKMRCFFNPPPPISLADGLRRTADHVRGHGSPEPTVLSHAIEVPRRMPPAWLESLESLRSDYNAKLAAARHSPRCDGCGFAVLALPSAGQPAGSPDCSPPAGYFVSKAACLAAGSFIASPGGSYHLSATSDGLFLGRGACPDGQPASTALFSIKIDGFTRACIEGHSLVLHGKTDKALTPVRTQRTARTPELVAAVTDTGTLVLVHAREATAGGRPALDVRRLVWEAHEPYKLEDAVAH
eukprot:m.60076 g.60076  ORF g.60076 m.60076 type:complete len:581 (-) comp7002_c0_seq2:68-1810(-)